MVALGVLLFFFGLIVIGMPIFGAMGIAALTGVVLLDESTTPLLNLGLTVYQSLGNFLLIAVPLYIYAGTLMEVAGLNEKLFKFARVWVGQVPGGLGVATVVACAIFAAICGSSVATAVTIGLVAFPALVRGGYTPHFSGSLIAAGGTLGILIPPSIAMIIFGVLTEQSIAQLFIAGALPGVLLASLMAIYAILFSKVKSDPEPVTWRQRIAVTREAILVLLLPLGVLVSIYSGLATPTEVAALAVVYVIFVGLITRMLTWSHFFSATMKAICAGSLRPTPLITTNCERTWPWTRIRRAVGQSNGSASSLLGRSSAGCTINTAGRSILQGHLQRNLRLQRPVDLPSRLLCHAPLRLIRNGADSN